MKNFTRIALAAALVAVPLGTAVQAQMASPATVAPETVQAGNYKVEASHTRVGFGVSHMGFSDWYGEFADVTGTMQLDPANLANARVDVTIPVATIATTNTKLDDELRSAGWLDAAQFPNIRFTSTSVVKTGVRTAQVTGNLTMHGVTRPVVLDATFNGAGANPMNKAYTVGFNATAHIKRSDFGVKTYLPLIGDDVTIRISAAFERQS